MLAYIAFFAGLTASLVLAAVYLADRYEREPLNAIQDAFLMGALAQAAAVLLLIATTHDARWNGWWTILTLIALVGAMPGHLRRGGQADEVFDGIVYSVSAAAGAVCIIHLANLPTLVTSSPHHAAFTSVSLPDLRDLLIIAGTPGFAGELGSAMFLLASAVLAGTAIGRGHLSGTSPWKTSATALAVTGPLMVLDILSGGHGGFRAAVAFAAVVTAIVVKRRSVFRHDPRATEPEVLRMLLKTILIVFGVCLVFSVLFSAVGRELPADASVPELVEPQP